MRERQVIPVSWYVSCGILSLLAIILTQVPLFNVLGYESAFALGLLTTIVSWFWGLRQQRSHDRLTRTLVLGLAQHIPPLIILSLNAFIVQNCNFFSWTDLLRRPPVNECTLCCTLGLRCI